MINNLNNYTSIPLDPKLRKIVGKHGGIVHSIQNIILSVDDPHVYFSIAVPNNPKLFQNGTDGLIEVITSGVGETEENANNSAVGEAVERYCAGYVQKNRVLFSFYNRDNGKHMVIDDYIEGTHEGYNINENSRQPIYGWVEGKNLLNDKEILVPAAIVWDTYKPIISNETYLTYGQVSGSACGKTYTEASINGLLEVIERDSFMITWLNKLAVPKIDVFSFLKVKEIFGGFFEQEKFELHLFDTTTDIGIPTVFGFMKTTDGKLYVGGSARLDMESAVIKTLFEIAQLYIGNKNSMYSSDNIHIEANEIRECSDRVFYYLQKETHKNLDFLYASEITKSYDNYDKFNGDNLQALEHIIESLKAANLDAIVVDVTTEDVKSAELSVVKAIIPGAVPLIFNENEKYLTSQRIFNVPVKLNYYDKSLKETQLNTAPHPFP